MPLAGGEAAAKERSDWLRDGQQWREAPDPAAAGGAGPSRPASCKTARPERSEWAAPKTN